MDWNNNNVLEFLDIYEKYPEIWDPTNEMHKNRNKVYDTWCQIRNEFSIDQSIDDLKKKKESLMSTYRTLRKKVIDSITSGCSIDQVYKPSWFAFQTMDGFLQKTGKVKPTINTERRTYDLVDEEEPDERNEQIEQPNASNKTSKQVFRTPLATANKKTRNTHALEIDSNIERHLKQATDTLEFMKHKPPRVQSDECSLYGELLAMKLRALSQITRKKLTNKIDNLVFDSEIRELNSSYSLIPQLSTTGSPISQTSSSRFSAPISRRSSFRSYSPIPQSPTKDSHNSNSSNSRRSSFRSYSPIPQPHAINKSITQISSSDSYTPKLQPPNTKSPISRHSSYHSYSAIPQSPTKNSPITHPSTSHYYASNSQPFNTNSENARISYSHCYSPLSQPANTYSTNSQPPSRFPSQQLPNLNRPISRPSHSYSPTPSPQLTYIQQAINDNSTSNPDTLINLNDYYSQFSELLDKDLI